jgi:hypothetical protein
MTHITPCVSISARNYQQISLCEEKNKYIIHQNESGNFTNPPNQVLGGVLMTTQKIKLNTNALFM